MQIEWPNQKLDITCDGLSDRQKGWNAAIDACKEAFNKSIHKTNCPVNTSNEETDFCNCSANEKAFDKAQGNPCPCQSLKSKWYPIITKEHWSLIAESELPNSIKQWLYESLEAISKCNSFGQPSQDKAQGLVPLDLNKLKKYSGIYGLPPKEYTLVDVDDLKQFGQPSPTPGNQEQITKMWQENKKELWDALGLIREAVNEITPLPSEESLLPEPMAHAQVIVEAVSKLSPTPGKWKELDEKEVYRFTTSFCLGLLDSDKFKILHNGTVPLLPSERRLFAEQFCAIFATKTDAKGPSEEEINSLFLNHAILHHDMNDKEYLNIAKEDWKIVAKAIHALINKPTESESKLLEALKQVTREWEAREMVYVANHAIKEYEAGRS